MDLWSPMRQLQPLRSQVYMDYATCLFTFDFLPLNKRFRRYTGNWLVRQGTTALFSGTRSLSWGFLLVFLWCLTWESWPQGLPSMSAVMLRGRGKPLGIWELDAKSRRSWVKKTSRIRCSESSPGEEPPHSLWSPRLWQRELQDSEMRRPKISQGAVFQGHSSALGVHLTVARCCQHKRGAVGSLHCEWSHAPIGFGLWGVGTEAGPAHFPAS